MLLPLAGLPGFTEMLIPLAGLPGFAGMLLPFGWTSWISWNAVMDFLNLLECCYALGIALLVLKQQLRLEGLISVIDHYYVLAGQCLLSKMFLNNIFHLM